MIYFCYCSAGFMETQMLGPQDKATLYLRSVPATFRIFTFCKQIGEVWMPLPFSRFPEDPRATYRVATLIVSI